MKRSEFVRAVYEKIGAYTTQPRIDFGVAWAAFENSEALNNPWDTTEPWANASDYNTTGVKNYATWEEGIDATVATLENGYYTHLLAVLRSDVANINDCMNSLNGSPWGSKVDGLLYSDVVANYAKYDTEVAGSPAPVVAVTEPVEVGETATEEKTETPAEQNKEHSEAEATAHVNDFTKLPVLKEGSTGRAVLTASAILWYGNRAFEPTSVFTPAMTTAVKEYQNIWGLKEDGIIGATTWASFFI